jgi:hypothetical protein
MLCSGDCAVDVRKLTKLEKLDVDASSYIARIIAGACCVPSFSSSTWVEAW